MTREELEHEYAALKAENAALRAQLQALVARVQELEGRLAKDSHHSSKPPSSDGVARKPRTPKSLRKKSGRKPGGQSGHRGSHLRLVAQPDAVVTPRPTTCGTCHTPLAPTAWAWSERRQVHEVPPLRLVVTEHQIAQVQCPACGATTRGQVPAAVRAPVQYGPRLRALAVDLVHQQCVPAARTRALLAEVFSAPLAVGTVVRLVQQAGEQLHAGERQITRRLRRAAVLHHDETGLRVVGTAGAGLQWTQVTSTPQLTHYAVHPQRGARGPRRPWHPAALPRREPAGRLDGLPPVPALPLTPRAVRTPTTCAS